MGFLLEPYHLKENIVHIIITLDKTGNLYACMKWGQKKKCPKISLRERIYTVCHSLFFFYFRLKPLFISEGRSKSKNGIVQFQNSGMKGLKNLPPDITDWLDADFAELGKVTLPDCLDWLSCPKKRKTFISLVNSWKNNNNNNHIFRHINL